MPINDPRIGRMFLSIIDTYIAFFVFFFTFAIIILSSFATIFQEWTAYFAFRFSFIALYAYFLSIPILCNKGCAKPLCLALSWLLLLQ